MVIETVRQSMFDVYTWFLNHVRWTGLGRKWPFEQLHLWVVSLLRPDKIVDKGRVFFLDRPDNCHLSYGHDLHGFDVDFLQSQLRAGDIVADVGANIGYYSVSIAERVGSAGVVHAFEPEPENFRLLSRNIQANGLTNVNSIAAAVTSLDKPVTLFLSKTHGGQHRLHESAVCSGAITVPGIRLDGYFARFGGSVDVIKLDVEGEEYQCLLGAEELFQRRVVRAVFLEYCPTWILESGDRLTDAPEFLRRHGFQCFEVDTPNSRICPANFESIVTRFPVGSRRCTNLWFYREC